MLVGKTWVVRMNNLKIGDKVLYYFESEDDYDSGINYYECYIEKDYGNGVYLIGNGDFFCDLVPETLLKKVDWQIGGRSPTC